MASVWVGLVVGVPSYYLAGSLVDLGMSWWQGVATVFLGNALLLPSLLLTAAPAARHGVSFPVLARAAFGPRGTHIPSLLVACGWFGIESWIPLPPHCRIPSNTFPAAIRLLRLLLDRQLAIVWRGMDSIRALEKYSAPVLAVLLCWAYVNAGGFGRMLSLTSCLSAAEFRAVFFPSLNANVSF